MPRKASAKTTKTSKKTPEDSSGGGVAAVWGQPADREGGQGCAGAGVLAAMPEWKGDVGR